MCQSVPERPHSIRQHAKGFPERLTVDLDNQLVFDARVRLSYYGVSTLSVSLRSLLQKLSVMSRSMPPRSAAVLLALHRGLHLKWSLDTERHVAQSCSLMGRHDPHLRQHGIAIRQRIRMSLSGGARHG